MTQQWGFHPPWDHGDLSEETEAISVFLLHLKKVVSGRKIRKETLCFIITGESKSPSRQVTKQHYKSTNSPFLQLLKPFNKTKRVSKESDCAASNSWAWS